MKPEERLPSQLWSIDTGVAPFVTQANEHSLSWAREMGLIQSQEAEKRLKGFCVGEAACRAYPSAQETFACLTADWITWLDCLDDETDSDEQALDPDGFEQALGLINDVAVGRADKDAAGPLGRALADLFDRSLAHTNSNVGRRLQHHVTEYLIGNAWQTAYRYQSKVPDLDHYPQMRREAGSILIAFDLIEIVEQSPLPASLYYSRTYQRLLMAAADTVCWSNDLLTVDKEILSGDTLNLVLAIQESTRITYQEAFQQARTMTGDRIDDFLAAEKELDLMCDALGTDPALRSGLIRCVQGLRAWMRGHADWGISTLRYFSDESLLRPSYLENLFPNVPRQDQVVSFEDKSLAERSK